MSSYSTIPGLDTMDTALTAFLAIYLVAILFAFVFGIISYVLQSVGMYTIAKRRGIHNPWMAWVPVVNMWILGSISDQYQYVAKGKVRNRRKTLLGLTIALTVTIVLFYIGILGLSFSAIGSPDSVGSIVGFVVLFVLLYLALLVVAIIAAVFQYIALYDLFVSSRPNGAVAFLVLGIIFSFLLPFFIFACRKKDGGMPPKREATQVAQLPEEPVYEQDEAVTEEDFEPEE